MTPLLDRLARAYGPLAARTWLVEGVPCLPAPSRPVPPRRLVLFALLAALFGRRP